MTRNYTITTIRKDGTHVVESSGFCHKFEEVRATMHKSFWPFSLIQRIVVTGPDGNTVLFYINKHGVPESQPTGNRQVQQWYSEERDEESA